MSRKYPTAHSLWVARRAHPESWGEYERRERLAEIMARALCRMAGGDPDEMIALSRPWRRDGQQPRWRLYSVKARELLAAQGWPEVMP